MRTYDPLDGVVYVRMARDADPYANPVASSTRLSRLPRGYANKSPRTRLKE